MSGINMNYIKSMDGMRGVGVLAVMLGHWQLAFPHIPFGWEFIQWFFLLSGFLITRILLHDKEKTPEFKPFMVKFFKRRAFRIFPIYFAYIIAMLLLRAATDNPFIEANTQELKHNTGWLFAYLYNFAPIYNYVKGNPYEESNFFSHLWTLSIEEQFYLIFPFIVYFLSRKQLKFYIIFVIVTTQILRIVGYPLLKTFIEDDLLIARLLFRNTIFQFDSICYGAALAVFSFEKVQHPRRWTGIFFVILIIAYAFNGYLVATKGVTLTIASGEVLHYDKLPFMTWLRFNATPEMLTQHYRHVYNILLVNIFWLFFLLSSIRGVTILPKVFESDFFVTVGKYSYGMYLYHFAIITIFLHFIKIKSGIPRHLIESNMLVQLALFLVYAAITYCVSKLSFDHFEDYFLKLKDKIK